MCGITGLVSSKISQHPLKNFLQEACHLLRHRGPDDQQFYIDHKIALGVARLAIRDPSKGLQPMQRRGFVIVFNGELYDTQPLKQKLLNRGYTFDTNSDTEILLNGFIEFGPSLLPDLVGMFAFAIWDSKHQTLYLARDRWGEKPLYYTFQDQLLAFASEIKSLKAWPGIDWDVQIEDLHLFLKNSYLPSPRTGWKNIHKLEPGCFLIWQQGQLTKHRYFVPTIREEKQGTLEESQELFQLLKSSVQQCLVSDRPLGAFLSGGIDSTTIAYLLTQSQPKAPIFSLFWDDENYSEEKYIKEAAEILNLNHFFVKCDDTFFLDHFDTVASLYDEPFADESMFPTYCLAQFAKQQVDVVLTGDGSDEFFHGYERYFFEGEFERYLDVFAATPQEIHRLICTPDFLSCEPPSPFLSNDFPEQRGISKARMRSFLDIQSYLPDDILTKVDRACMGVCLEARAPFLTPQVTNFALQCSMQGLVGQKRRGKEILRRAMEGRLPSLILERKKMGFGMPLNDWFRSSLEGWMMERLFQGHLLKTGWFSKEGLHQLVLKHQRGEGHYARTLLNLLVLELWIRKHQEGLCRHQPVLL